VNKLDATGRRQTLRIQRNKLNEGEQKKVVVPAEHYCPSGQTEAGTCALPKIKVKKVIVISL
jgi:hypothetical protein